MAANVRCTSDACRIFINHGIGAARCGQPSAAHPDATALAFHHHYSPCGWRGKRYNTISYGVSDGRDLTAKPCPRCGGQVELIQQDGAP